MVTQDDALAERLRRLRLHGGAKQYIHDEVGYNSRLDTLQAAVLLAKLPHLAEWSAAPGTHAARYTEAFSAMPGGLPAAVPTRRTSTSSTSTRSGCRGGTRSRRISRPRGSATAIYYPLSLHLQPCFASPRATQAGSLPRSEQAAEDVLSLPIFPELTDAQLDQVIDAIAEFYR